MKITALKLGLIAGLSTILTACSSTTVIPQTGGMYSVLVTSSSPTYATKLAAAKAQAICADRHGELQLIDQETVYQGIDKAEQKLVQLANEILPKNTAAGPYTPPDHEYKTTLVFKCE